MNKIALTAALCLSVIAGREVATKPNASVPIEQRRQRNPTKTEFRTWYAERLAREVTDFSA